MIEVLMKPDDIRNTILKAIFSDSDLKENLVLKGGTALKLHNITDRSSQDLDFSIEESIRYDKDVEGKKLQGLISDAFKQIGFLVVGFEFIEKPKKRIKNYKIIPAKEWKKEHNLHDMRPLDYLKIGDYYYKYIGTVIE